MCCDELILMSVIYGRFGFTGAIELAGWATSKATTYKEAHTPANERHILHSMKKRTQAEEWHLCGLKVMMMMMRAMAG